MQLTGSHRLRLWTITAAAAAAVVLTTQAAVAAPSYTYSNPNSGAGSCGWNICLWSEPDFVRGSDDYKMGSLGTNDAISDMGKIKLHAGVFGDYGMQDIASSVVNRSSSKVCFYSDNNYQGANFQIGPHESWATIPSWIDDKISSFKYC